MRPGPWLLLLSLLLSTLASAQDPPNEQAFQWRTLVAPARPDEVPPLELHIRAGVATLVRFEAPLRLGAMRHPAHEERIQLVRMNDETLIIISTTNLAEGEQIPLIVEAGPGARPLRFVLITRHDTVDVQVRVVLGQVSDDGAEAESMARNLLAAPDARATLAVPRETVNSDPRESRGQVQSLLWMGRRFFATVTVHSRKKGAPPWRLVQARLRATLPDGTLLEWPAHLTSGTASPIRQRYIVTDLLPEGASRLELALDGQDSPGAYQRLPMEEVPTRP
ncbi:DUF2381 family protein [Archangium violaceum]|uniref:DUF2381 family protein n=1 Tax=Archangium violaceum TaxID=83451 RepID=UPI00193C32D5|nr:DUF2381 family protein [Archangium violaceum]QRK08405.1 DUF2381 family protein [Archangium violaceum]